jgi:hypothetical protein
MKRITEYEESLNIVRAKCESKNTDFTKEELKHLSLANIELQKSYGKKFVKPLDKSCSYCVITAMNCIHNYINFEEPKTIIELSPSNLTKEEKVKIQEELKKSSKKSSQVIVSSEGSEIIPVTHIEVDGDFTGVIEKASQESIEELAKLPLKELRKKFPNIKARSIDRFIELLKDE